MIHSKIRLFRPGFFSGIILSALLLGVSVVAAKVPHTFQNGDLLSASSLNANFADLDGKIEALSARATAAESRLDALEAANTALSARVTSLEAQVAEIKGLAPSLCPAGYSHDTSQTEFVRCTRGAPVFDEVVRVADGGAIFWIDRYESSVWPSQDGQGSQVGLAGPDYPSSFPRNGQYKSPLFALSRPGVRPSADITWFQAVAACSASGKRLPTRQEWLLSALGTGDPGPSDGSSGTCNTQSALSRAAGGGPNCRSKWGAEDMIGNLWEWIDEWYAAPGGTSESEIKGDYVAQPWPVNFSDDRTWNIASAANTDPSSKSPGLPAAAVRGGSFGDGSLGGLFALSLNTSPAFGYPNQGFRCVTAR